MEELAEPINEVLSKEADDEEYSIVKRSIERSRKFYNASENVRSCEDVICSIRDFLLFTALFKNTRSRFQRLNLEFVTVRSEQDGLAAYSPSAVMSRPFNGA